MTHRIILFPAFAVYLIIALFIVGKELVLSFPTAIIGGVSVMQSMLRLHGLLFGIPLILLVGMALLGDLYSAPKSLRCSTLSLAVWLFFVVWLGIVGTVNGLLHANPTVYILGDLFKAVVIPLSMYLTIKYLRGVDPHNILLFLVICVLITLFPKFVNIIGQAVTSGEFKRKGTRSELLYVFALLNFLIASDKIKKVMWCLLVVLMLIGNIASQSRSAIFLTLFISGFIFMLVGRKRVLRSLAPLLAGLAVFSIIVIAVPAVRNTIAIFFEQAVKRASATYDSHSNRVDVSTYGRMLEVQYAFNEYKMNSDNIITLISHTMLGMGGGATYQIFEDTSHPRLTRYLERAEGRSHQIHVAFFSIFFRYGLVGLMLFNIVLLYIMHKAFMLFKIAQKCKDKKGMILTMTILSFLLVEYVHSISIYHVVGYLPLGIMFGLLVLYDRNINLIERMRAINR